MSERVRRFHRGQPCCAGPPPIDATEMLPAVRWPAVAYRHALVRIAAARMTALGPTRHAAAARKGPDGSTRSGRYRAAAVAVLACGMLWTTGAVDAVPPPLPSPPPLTLAVADLPAFAPALIAEAEGYYSAEGLALKVIHCINGRRCLKHLTDGEAQFAVAGDTPLVMASFGRSAFSIIATIATNPRESGMVVRADRGIHTPADLRGKRIGMLRGTTAHYFSDTFLLFHNISPSEVTAVALAVTDPVGPLLRGEVDAAVLYQPHYHLARQAMGTLGVALAVPRLSTMTFNLVGAPPALGGSDEDTTKLLRALQRANKLIVTEPARARAIVAARLKIELKLLEAIWGDYDFSLSLGQPLITTLEAQARWAVREGLLPLPFPNYLDYLRPGPLQAVDRRAVTVVK